MVVKPTSTIWQRYKLLWQQIPMAKSPTELKAALAQLKRLNLNVLFHDEELAANLRDALIVRGKARQDVLRTSFWKGDKRYGEKRYRYDPAEALQRHEERFGYDVAALRGLLGLGIADRWILETLIPAVAVDCQTMEAAGRQPSETAQGLLNEAHALLAQATSQ